MKISVVRGPSLFWLAMEVAPLVRRGILTDAEGHWLVTYRHWIGWNPPKVVE